MSTNEELCERVLPLKKCTLRAGMSVDLTPEDCRARLKEALTQGILIPAEKMLTEDELREIIVKEMSNGSDGFYLAKAIHQSSRQKAGAL